MPHMSAGQILTAGQYNTDVHQGIVLLDEQVLETATGTVTFSSIDQSAQTLWILRSGSVDPGSGSNTSVFIQFNGDTGANYLEWLRAFVADGSEGEIYNTANGKLFVGSGATAASMTSILIPNYARSDRHKPVQVEYSKLSSTSAADVEAGKVFGRWASTAAVTQIDFVTGPADATHEIGSIFSLYGLGAGA